MYNDTYRDKGEYIMSEIWKSVKGWEDLYEVSNFGNIRSLHYKNPYLMKPILDNKGYLRVSFVEKNSKRYKRFAVHRLVAEAFISNPNNLPQVNHKDENKQNNCVDNLEWCTNKYNCNYGKYKDKVRNSRIGMRFSELHRKNLSISHIAIQGKAVDMFSSDERLLAEFDCISTASKQTGISTSCISHCCNGRTKSSGGYIFRFKNEGESYDI